MKPNYNAVVYIRGMRFLIVILFIALAHLSHAQRYVFQQWGTDDGLPTSTVNDITEDPLGFIWLATDGAGLVRFDGSTFSQPIPTDSLPSPFVTVLRNDSLGNFWIGTEKGPAYYDGKNLNLFEGMPKALATRINTIVIDHPNDVWFGTRNGLFHFNGQSFSAPPSDPEVTSLHSFSDDFMHNRLVYLTPKGLAGDLKFDSIYLTETGALNRLLTAGDSLIMVGTNGTYSGKKKLSKQNDFRDAMLVDGSYWLGSSSTGIHIINQFGERIINANSGLGFDRIRCLYKSKNGTIWVGSLSGLSKLTSRHLTIYDQSQGISDERIHATFQAQNGEIWTGSVSGVSRFNPADTTVTNFGVADGFPAGVVLDITQDTDGNIWFGTERGLIVFTGEAFRRITLADPFTFSVECYQDKLYIGTSSGMYVKNGSTFNRIETGGEGFVQLITTSQGLRGISLLGGLYNIDDKQLTRIKQLNNLNIDTLRINQIAQTESHLAMAVDGIGIYICNETTCRLFNVDDDLQSLSIQALAANSQRFWIGTEKGLFSAELKKDLAEINLQFYSVETGYRAKECNERAMYMSQIGELLIGTNSGLYRIDESEFAKRQSGSLYITNIDLLFNQNTDWTSISEHIKPWSSIPENINLPYEQNYLTFHFAAPVFTGQQIYVRYKLEGQDKEWTVAQDRMEAIFTDISPGKYTFKVQSSATPTFRNTVEASLPVSIIPPFYRTSWFWVLLGLVLVTISFFIVQYRINQLNARLALESALADSERKALRLQMNPHFVFNALDAISGFIFKNEPKEAVRYLTSFAKLMRFTLESSRETMVPLQNEIQLLKNYVDLEQLRFSNSFDYNIEVTDEVDPYEVYIPPMLLQPFVENAILHGLRYLEGKRGILNIHFDLVDEELVCLIKDNGVGRKVSAERNAKRMKTSLATSITEERIKLLSQSLGRKVRFNIDDLVDEDGAALGTSVTLTFPQLAGDDET